MVRIRSRTKSQSTRSKWCWSSASGRLLWRPATKLRTQFRWSEWVESGMRHSVRDTGMSVRMSLRIQVTRVH